MFPALISILNDRVIISTFQVSVYPFLSLRTLPKKENRNQLTPVHVGYTAVVSESQTAQPNHCDPSHSLAG